MPLTRVQHNALTLPIRCVAGSARDIGVPRRRACNAVVLLFLCFTICAFIVLVVTGAPNSLIFSFCDKAVRVICLAGLEACRASALRFLRYPVLVDGPV